MFHAYLFIVSQKLRNKRRNSRCYVEKRTFLTILGLELQLPVGQHVRTYAQKCFAHTVRGLLVTNWVQTFQRTIIINRKCCSNSLMISDHIIERIILEQWEINLNRLTPDVILNDYVDHIWVMYWARFILLSVGPLISRQKAESTASGRLHGCHVTTARHRSISSHCWIIPSFLQTLIFFPPAVTCKLPYWLLEEAWIFHKCRTHYGLKGVYFFLHPERLEFTVRGFWNGHLFCLAVHKTGGWCFLCEYAIFYLIIG